MRWLDDQHRELDHLLADVEFMAEKRSFATAGQRFKEFRNSLTQHLHEEEEELFPRWRAQGEPETGLLQLQRQHLQLECALDAVLHSLSQGDYSDFCYGLDALSHLLAEHQGSEEHFVTQLTEGSRPHSG